jgi:hypothetical protein
MTFDEHGHIDISPREVQDKAFDDPDGLINHALMPGTPMGFPLYAQYARFIDYLSSRTGIHPHHFLFRGSTKVGFSISPNRKQRKLWRNFGPGSDLDLAIVDPHFFASVDEQVRRWDRLPDNRDRILRWRIGAEFKQYRARVDQKGRHDCYRFFDLPRRLERIVELQDVLNNAPIRECCAHPFIELKAFIFRDRWAVHRRYHSDLDELRRGLTARHDPLPPATDESLPAESADE